MRYFLLYFFIAQSLEAFYNKLGIVKFRLEIVFLDNKK